MMFDEYKQFTDSVSIYPGAGEGTKLALAYAALGLNGEAGEVAEKVKKHIRDGGTIYELRDKLVGELGDVIFYWTRMCVEAGVNPHDVIEANIDKLSSRKERGVLGGSGDNR